MNYIGQDADANGGFTTSGGTVVYNITQGEGVDETRLQEIENKNDEQDLRLTALETTSGGVGGDPLIDGLQNTRLDALESGQITQNGLLVDSNTKDTEQNLRLDELETDVNELQANVGAIELKDEDQDLRLDDIDILNTTQNSRLDQLRTATLENEDNLSREELRITANEQKDIEQDTRLDQLSTATLENENLISELDLQADLADDKNIQQDLRLASLETSDTAQNTRLDSIEAAQGADGKNNMFNYSGQPVLDTQANVADPLFGFTGQGGRESGGNEALYTLGLGGEITALKAGVVGALDVVATPAVKLTYFRVNRDTTLQSIYTSLRGELQVDVSLLPVAVNNADTIRIIVGVKRLPDTGEPPILDDLLSAPGDATVYSDFDIQTEVTYSPYDGTVLDATGSTLLANAVGVVSTVGGLLGTVLNNGEATIKANLNSTATPPITVSAGDFILTGVKVVIPQDLLAGINLKVAMNASASVEYI